MVTMAPARRLTRGVSQTMVVNSPLQRLCKWYTSQCDGEWEHDWGLKIQTLDNPGWCVEINLRGTQLEDAPFDVHEDCYQHDTDWIRCWLEEQTFHIACGPERLDAALQVFLDWATSIEDAG